MAARYFIDTNILIYSVGIDPAEEGKRSIARWLIDRDGGSRSLQVLHEFSAQITRESRRDPLTMTQAA